MNLLEDLKVVMYQHWCPMNGLTKEQNTTKITPSAFSGICYQCQQTGHKPNSCCPKKKPSENGD
jgi:hypothetical protein